MKRGLSGWLGVLIAASGCLAAERPAGYPRFSWDTVPVFAHLGKPSGPFTDAEARFLVEKFPIVCLEKIQGLDVPGSEAVAGMCQAARQLKELNADVTLFFYLNLVINYPQYAAAAEFTARPEWHFRDKEGAPVLIRDRHLMFDHRQPSVRQWWVDICVDALEQAPFDGVFADAVGKTSAAEPQRRRRWGDRKYDQLQCGVWALFDELRAALGPGKLIVYNGLSGNETWWDDGGLRYLEATDGAMCEHFTAFSARDEHGKLMPDVVARNIDMIQRAAAAGKITLVKGWPGTFNWIEETKPPYRDMTPEQKLAVCRERLEFNLAAFLAAAGPYSYFGYSWGYGDNDGWWQWYDEFDRPLGPPQGPPRRKGHVYTREFEHASVWLDLGRERARITWR